MFAGSNESLTPRDASVPACLSDCDRPRLAHVQCQPRHHGEQPARRSLVHAGPALQEVRRHGRSSAVLWEAAQGNTAPLQQGLFCTEIPMCCRRNCLVCGRLFLLLPHVDVPVMWYQVLHDRSVSLSGESAAISVVNAPYNRCSYNTTNAVGGIAIRPTAA